ncbi:CHAT domain-containing protein [Catalinimonas niigatensis]|uniref:CHAT domain-containing protein n=1 Tax=Catalinimonas niigatensis TaxID=1397264 RepID=UPI002665264D|nr:CHAT domain-containing protein [Catalinimonas niigatensis]WPP49749.1 CHAT domain-containing protein [Catalinimonas niigatensis]
MRPFLFLLALLLSNLCFSVFAQENPVPTAADRLYQQGQFPQAALAYHELVIAWQNVKNADSARYYQLREAKSYIQEYEYQKARSLLEAILSWKTPPLDSALLSPVYHEIGYTYVGEADFQQALEYVEKSISTETERSSTDSFQLAKSYELKGFIHMQRQEYAAAKTWATAAHKLRKSFLPPLDKELGYSANTLYIILSTLGELYSADTVLAEAWQILNHQLPQDHPHVAIIANNYSSHLMDMGDPQNAKNYLQKAIASNRAGKRWYPLVFNYVNLGTLYMNLDESRTAQSYFQQAWTIADTLIEYPDYYRANLRDALGAVYYQQDQLEQADSLFKLALEEKQELYENQHAEIGQSMYNVGLIALEREQWPLAREYFNKSEQIRKATLGADHPKRADALYQLAEIDWKNNRQTAAIRQWRTSLRIYRQSFGLAHHHTLENLLQLAEVFAALEETDSTQFYLQLAWGSVCGLNQGLPDMMALDTINISQYHPQVLTLANFHLSHLLRHPVTISAQELTIGRFILERVQNWLPTFLSLFNDESLGESVADPVQEVYRQGAVLAHYALLEPNIAPKGWQSLLLDCIQASRGTTIQSAFRDRQAIRFAGVPDSLVQQGQLLRQQLRFVFARQQKIADEEGEAQEMPEQQVALFQEWQNFQQHLEKHYPDYYQTRFESPTVSPDDLQKALQQDDQSLLAYFHLDTALLVLHASADTFQTHWLSMPGGWQDSLYAYHALIQTQSELERQAHLGYFLYQHLWAPLSASLKMQVKVLADGPLYYLNFETLLSQLPALASSPARWPWLIREYCIFYGHSLPSSAITSSLERENILGVAPGFSQALKSDYQKSLTADQHPDSLFLHWLRTPWSTSFVQQLPRKGWGDALTAHAATEKQYLEKSIQANILHFGTHARLENEKPLYSFLALTPDITSQEDGYLHTYELYHQPLQARLAVLTACETGLGSYRRGEGVLSLAHAFRYAGCPSVIYSLWSIDDQQSNQIAELFYQNLQQDMTLAQALRAAKLAYLDDPEADYRAPYYWAGLVLTGENQSVQASSPWMTRQNILILLLGLLGAILLVWAVLKSRKKV